MRTITPPHFTHSTGLTSKTFFKDAAYARADARTALRAARSTFPNTVTEYPASSSVAPAFCRAAWLTAHRKGERGPNAP